MSADKSGLPWSEADLALVKAQYPLVQTRVADLAATLGRTVQQVVSKAHVLELSRPAGALRSPLRRDLRAALIEAAAKPNGFGCSELVEGAVTARQVHAVTSLLVSTGAIFRAKVTHKHVRFFASAAAAARYEAAHAKRPPGVVVRAAPNASFNAGPGSKTAPWPADAPMVITAKTKITVAPTPPRMLRTNTHSQ